MTTTNPFIDPEVPPTSFDDDTATLLTDIIALFRRFISLPEPDDYLALGLWVLVTHSTEAFARYPYLFIGSPERECGKTQLLELLESVVARPWKIDGPPTEAVVFRKLDADRVTLLLDEVDQLFRLGDNRTAGLIAILNAGYKRNASVPRVVGDGANMSTKDFAVFGPKAYAGINAGAIPDTLRSRSIAVQLHRLPPGQRVDRWRSDREEPATGALRDRAAEWATAHVGDLAAYRCPELVELSPRSEEIWEPMFAIAALAGREQEAIELAVRLSTTSSPAVSIGSALLAKLRDTIGEAQSISTADALRSINLDETLPFTGYNDGDGMTPRDLARTLKKYGVSPTSIRPRGAASTAKGYKRADLAAAWNIYAPIPSTPEQPEPTEHRCSKGHENARDLGVVPDAPHVPVFPSGDPHRGAVPVTNPFFTRL